MKFLLDENLSARLIKKIESCYPGSTHIKELGMLTASDDTVWEFAKSNDYIIVSKDWDFEQRARLSGPPPKVIRLRTGNCDNSHIAMILINSQTMIHDFYHDSVAACLVIG